MILLIFHEGTFLNKLNIIITQIKTTLSPSSIYIQNLTQDEPYILQFFFLCDNDNDEPLILEREYNNKNHCINLSSVCLCSMRVVSNMLLLLLYVEMHALLSWF